VIEMLETADFFEQRIKECRSSAAQSRNKNDREFWLKMAARWEGLLKSREKSDDEPVTRLSITRSRFRRSMLLAGQAAKRRRAA
jgi:hypothetical protein